MNGFLCYRKSKWNKEWRCVKTFLEGKQDDALYAVSFLSLLPHRILLYCPMSITLGCLHANAWWGCCLWVFIQCIKFCIGLFKSRFSQCAGKVWIIKDLVIKYRKVKSQPQMKWCVDCISFLLTRTICQKLLGKLLGNHLSFIFNHHKELQQGNGSTLPSFSCRTP